MARQPVPAQHNHTYYAHDPGAGRAHHREPAMPDPFVTTGFAASPHYEDVDVAIVAESTYPYLKGGVSAVVHDIVQGNQDLTFGIIHITWDSSSPAEDLYGMPANVKWVRPVYLSMDEHEEDFKALRPKALRMRRSERSELAHRLIDALEAIVAGDVAPMWQLYDEGMNPRTRTYPIWALLGTKEFMEVLPARLPHLGLSLVDTFWLMREFFSLGCAVMSEDLPKAKVYHAHTTGYAALLSAAAARQNDTSFLLTEHNLYVRDTVNLMLERSMALPLTASDWRTFDVTPQHRAWMMWWIEMGRFCYPSAEAITFLYPKAITEAADLGAPVEKSVVIPNGMIVRKFDGVYGQRMAALEDIKAAGPDRVWRLVYIARVVPIKGLSDLISTLALLVEQGVTNFHLDILGPTDHMPDYYRLCREKARTLNVQEYMTFRGTVNVREMLGDFDILVLPSYNEGQPIVVLEAMTAGIPTVGTSVGGMEQLVDDPLTTPGGQTWGPSGLLVRPDYVHGMAVGLKRLMGDVHLYEELAHNARGRVCDFFQLEDAMGAYNRLYRELGRMPVANVQDRELTAEPVDHQWSDEVADRVDSRHAREQPRTGFAARSGGFVSRGHAPRHARPRETSPVRVIARVRRSSPRAD
jgi:polysaccharide biosynthesis protein PelF